MNVMSMGGMGGMMNMGGMRGMGGMKGMGKPPSADEMMKKMDQDGDGSINSAEAKGPLSKMFSGADTDGNGKLDSAELQKAMEAFQNQIKGQKGLGAPPSAADLIAKMDKDGDGDLSGEEAEGPLADRFAKADTNGDGKVDQKELEADMKTMRKEGGPGKSGQAPSSQDLLKLLDANGDGTLAADEMKGPLSKQFGRIDANGDGKVTQDELQTGLDTLRQQHEKGEGKQTMGRHPGTSSAFGLANYSLSSRNSSLFSTRLFSASTSQTV
ncbi:MAG: EF-hand domain-containing protein [Magnetococcales bacterium]|nr:EF-hand domain-containing protein [Magnetococcales bacterium]